MALVTIGTEEALNLIDRAGLRGFIFSMKQHNGSFTVHAGGEIDVRCVRIRAVHWTNWDNFPSNLFWRNKSKPKKSKHKITTF
jgi:hypothetical protein